MKVRFFVLCLMTVLLGMSLGSCKKVPTSAEQNKDIEVSEGINEEIDSLNATTDSISAAEGTGENKVILRKTKAQYVIY